MQICFFKFPFQETTWAPTKAPTRTMYYLGAIHAKISSRRTDPFVSKRRQKYVVPDQRLQTLLGVLLSAPGCMEAGSGDKASTRPSSDWYWLLCEYSHVSTHFTRVHAFLDAFLLNLEILVYHHDVEHVECVLSPSDRKLSPRAGPWIRCLWYVPYIAFLNS